MADSNREKFEQLRIKYNSKVQKTKNNIPPGIDQERELQRLKDEYQLKIERIGGRPPRAPVAAVPSFWRAAENENRPVFQTHEDPDEDVPAADPRLPAPELQQREEKNKSRKVEMAGISRAVKSIVGFEDTEVTNRVYALLADRRKGQNVVLEQSYGDPKVTKDGVTVAKSIEFRDRVKNRGASLVNQVADIAGDGGTTCATVLTRAIYSEGCKSVAAGMNAMDLRRGITMAVDAVVTYLKSRARMISTSEEIAQVGTISANGEREIGELIAEAMEKVGKEGVITIADGKTLENELEVVEGMKLDRGYISPYFITNTKTQKCELDDPLILIHEKKISSLNSIVKVLELALKKNRPLLIVAEDIESEALATLIPNKLQAETKVCAIKAPGFGENRKAHLQDLAILTGGEVITEELGMNLEKAGPELLGTCKKVIISKDDTVVLDGAGDKKSIEERCEQLRSTIELSTSDYDKEKLQERLAKLSGGVAVLKIGGASEAEVSEKKDRVTDALNATKAAVEEGIVPGGGVALLYASKELDKLQTANFDQKIGVQIIQNALKAPVHTIASNAGVEGAIVVGKLLEQDDYDLGYDAAKGQYVNMVEAGIIDPLKVIRTALVDAASVSSLLTTTEADVVELPKDKKDMPAMNPGMGMGDY